ncbi:Xaa-Pro peptidase family protein [Moorella naiadis]|uniref:M24 family metallopeptidase n=1 Tax=Moorella naiadis (nom. illeg.) TaxID=3093670 RepID=UPI003D9CBAF1
MRYLEFPVAEVKERIKKLQQGLAKAGMKGAIITAESNFYYFTGYRTHTPWTTHARATWLFIPADGEGVLLVHSFVVPEAKSRSVVTDVRSYDSLLGTPIGQVKEIMTELGMNQGRIGMELGREQRLGIDYQHLEALRKELPSAEFEDISKILWDLRMIKSPSEIDFLRLACQAADYALDHVFDEIHEGMTEKEISRRVSRLMLEGGAEGVGFVIIVSGKGNYERISAIATERKLEKGDMVWLDISAMVGGYFTDYCRAGVVGGPTGEQIRLWDITHAVTMKAIAKITPGMPIAEIARECGRAMQERGIDLSFDCGRMGHGIGLNSTEPPHNAVYDDTILQPGMTFTVEPGIVNDLGVFDIEENVVVTANGYELLSRADRNLHTIR